MHKYFSGQLCDKCRLLWPMHRSGQTWPRVARQDLLPLLAVRYVHDSFVTSFTFDQSALNSRYDLHIQETRVCVGTRFRMISKRVGNRTRHPQFLLIGNAASGVFPTTHRPRELEMATAYMVERCSAVSMAANRSL